MLKERSPFDAGEEFSYHGTFFLQSLCGGQIVYSRLLEPVVEGKREGRGAAWRGCGLQGSARRRTRITDHLSDISRSLLHPIPTGTYSTYVCIEYFLADSELLSLLSPEPPPFLPPSPSQTRCRSFLIQHRQERERPLNRITI